MISVVRRMSGLGARLMCLTALVCPPPTHQQPSLASARPEAVRAPRPRRPQEWVGLRVLATAPAPCAPLPSRPPRPALHVLPAVCAQVVKVRVSMASRESSNEVRSMSHATREHSTVSELVPPNRGRTQCNSACASQPHHVRMYHIRVCASRYLSFFFQKQSGLTTISETRREADIHTHIHDRHLTSVS